MKIEKLDGLNYCELCSGIANNRLDGTILCRRHATESLTDMLQLYISCDIENRIVYRMAINSLLKGGNPDMRGSMKINLADYNDRILLL